jgi:hypothetical protein
MTSTRRLYFLGRTRWEVARNIIGLIFIFGAAAYVKLSPGRPVLMQRVVRIEIPESEHLLKSVDDFRRNFSTYNSLDQDLAVVAVQLKETPEQIKKLVNIDLDFRETGRLVVECTSDLTQEAVEKVCLAAVESTRKHLRLNAVK